MASSKSRYHFLLFLFENFWLDYRITNISILFLFGYQIFFGRLGHTEPLLQLGCFELVYNLDTIEGTNGIMPGLFSQNFTIKNFGVILINTIKPVNSRKALNPKFTVG